MERSRVVQADHSTVQPPFLAPQDQGPKHYSALDGIRGTAIVMVFICHFGGGAKSPNRIVRLAGLITQAGWTGVILFFVLSGFLISGILWDARESERWWINFYMRRALRIFPVYYAALALVFLTAALAHKAVQSLKHLWIFALYLQNGPFAAYVGTGSPLWTSHLWSLAVEEQFYLIWPFLLLRAKSLDQAKRLCLGVFLLSFVFRWASLHMLVNPMSHSEGLISQCGALATGGYLSMCFRQPLVWIRLQRSAHYLAPALLVAFIGIALRAGSFHADSQLMFVAGIGCIGLFYGALLVLAMGTGVTNRCMVTAPLRRMGKISYGFYVVHVLFIPVFLWVTTSIAPNASGTTREVIHAMVAGGMSYLLASLSLRYFELPFLKLRSKFRQAPPLAVASPSSP
jgi:peptidoglycan/LPS O-acetylase OafA/YrhL